MRGLENMEKLKLTKSSYDKVDCVACCKGKLTKLNTPSRSEPRVQEIGERLHVDIGGSVDQSTISGADYYILFKDEYSNFRFIYILKSRDEAFDCIRKTVSQIKSDTGKSVRHLVSDRGSEFTSKRTQEFLLNNSISHIISAPFTPSSNGFIERDNKTLMSGVRSLFNRNVPTKLWGRAALTFVYLLNRSINKNTVDKTLYKLC